MRRGLLFCALAFAAGPLFAGPSAGPDQPFLKILDSKRVFSEFELRATKGLWRKLQVTPEEMDEDGVVGYARLPFIYLTKITGSIFTMPFDVLAAPARTNLAVKWELSGQVVDSTGTAVTDTEVRLAVASCTENLFGDKNFCEAAPKTDAEGRFSCVLAGEFVETARIAMTAGIDTGKLKLQEKPFLVREGKVITLQTGDPPLAPKEFQLRLEAPK
ncbi:MAG: hypothetical protein HY922_02695 [Elusimicrobia bacterium]|nr:hypothetical protein [Elusimicrobiota bacterium]